MWGDPVFSRMAVALTPGLISGLLACSSQPEAPSLSIVGTWDQGARLEDAGNGQTHIHTGYFSFDQKGGGFSGTGQQSGLCHAASGDYEGPLASEALFHIDEGVQQGSNVSFRTPLCTYEGVMSDDNSHIDGTARCEYTDQGTHFVWTGEWLANRQR
jgi:hypothetical protein